MSRINELIADLCPDGVEFKALGDILKIKNGKDHKMLGDGTIPAYGSGGVLRHVDTAAATGPSVLIPRKGSLGNIFYVEGPFWIVDTIFRTEIDTSKIYPKYLYHQLLTMRLGEMNQAGGVPSQTQKALNLLKVPVPPLEVQREIVRVLDKFTQLEAELEAQRRQYDMARRTLLGKCKKSPILSLGKACAIKAGNLISKSVIEKSPGPYPVINSGREPLGFTSLYNTEDNPLGITSRGAGVGSVTWCLGRYFRGSLNYSVTIREPRILDTRFLFHTLNEYQKEIKSLCTFEGIPALNKKNLEKLEIPAPSLDIQKEVALTLDKLEVFVNDLSVGLPAELAARRKQYEYYRDRLLTFEEKR